MSEDPLWTSFANGVLAGREIEAILEALEERLAHGELGEVRIEADTLQWDNWRSGQDWIFPYCLGRYRLVSTGARARACGWLELGVSFWRPEDERGDGWEGRAMSKLYVAFSPPRSSSWTPENLVLDGTGRADCAAPVSAKRWVRHGTARAGKAWFFCVRLAALQGPEDLVREIVTPLRLLFDGQTDGAAFSHCRAVIDAPPLA